MKRLLYSTLIALSLLTASCEHSSDYGRDETIDFDEIFVNYELTSSFLNTCYASIPAFGATSASGTFLASFTDEAQDVNTVTAGNATLKYYNGEMSVNNSLFTGALYSKLFEGIMNCNTFLANIHNLEKYNYQADIKRWPSEVRILRAHYYLQLIKRYGPVPYLDETNYKDYDYSKMVRPTFYENVEKIIADCELALEEGGEDLPWRLTIENDKGRVTKAMAHAIMSQAILFAASPLWNESNDPAIWQEAASITKRAMEELETNGYGLMDKVVTAGDWYSKYQELFMLAPEYDKAVPDADTETIYAQKGQIGTIWNKYGVPTMTGVERAGMSPSQELVDAYDTADGKPVLNLANPYSDEEHLTPNYNINGMYDPQNPYASRDPRLRSTIVCNGDNWNISGATGEVQTYEGGNCEISATSLKSTKTGYYLRKYVSYKSNASTNSDGYWRHYRMGEIYLNYAEAEFYANGVTSNAIAAINKTRQRAFDVITYPEALIQSGVSSDEFEQRLRNERRVELAFEEHRYYDLRRWKLNADYEGQVTGMKITKDAANGALSYERFAVQKRAVTEDKYSLWPIPSTEEIRFKNLGVDFQNQGW